MNAIAFPGTRPPRVPEDLARYVRMAQSRPLVALGGLDREAVCMVATAARDVTLFDWPTARSLMRRLAGIVTRDNAHLMLRWVLGQESKSSQLMPRFALGHILAEGARAQGYYLLSADNSESVRVEIGEHTIVYYDNATPLEPETLVLLPRWISESRLRHPMINIDLRMRDYIVWRPSANWRNA